MAAQVRTFKGMGLVPDVFNKRRHTETQRPCGNRTCPVFNCGRFKDRELPASSCKFQKAGTIAIAHNGNLVNSKELRTELEKEGRIFLSDSDTEVIAHLLVKELMQPRA